MCPSLNRFAKYKKAMRSLVERSKPFDFRRNIASRYEELQRTCYPGRGKDYVSCAAGRAASLSERTLLFLPWTMENDERQLEAESQSRSISKSGISSGAFLVVLQ